MQNYLQDLNKRYLDLHIRKEDYFWSSKMRLKDAPPANEAERSETEFNRFIANADELPKIREALSSSDLSADEKIALEGWENFFKANAIESEEAKKIQAELVTMETALQEKRRDMKLGYVDPKSGEFIEAGTNKLSMMIGTEEDESLRKAAWEANELIVDLVLKEGFLDIVKLRNKMARILGFKNYYEYKLQTYEGFSTEKLFKIFDDFLEKTRPVCEQALLKLQLAHGKEAVQPWNYGFYNAGDIIKKIDPYFNFKDSVARWGRSFYNMGIRYRGAELKLDLIDRKGKYDNGFMHGPFPAFVDEGKFRPAKINFTSNAVIGQVGAGKRALQTLFHEGGHAAHFSNITMPAPCFAQEFAPTSVAFAETQSMFLDSIIDDPDWILRYAKDEHGKAPSWELIAEKLEIQSKTACFNLRPILCTVYAEHAMYCLDDAELTPENVRKLIEEVELKVGVKRATRSMLAVPHVLSAEASAYCHGYVLADMAVEQTRAYFIEKYGYLLDNPKIGEELCEYYWKPGNSKIFLDFIKDLTGKEFSAQAMVDSMTKSFAQLESEAKEAVAKEKELPFNQDKIDLGAKISLVHGDDIIADNQNSFSEMVSQFEAWIEKQDA